MITTVKDNYLNHKTGGFTLPTIVLASMMLMALLTVALQLATSSNRVLKDQHYNQLAREAAEAGNVRASGCLAQNNDLAQWTDSNRLKPDTDCNGNTVSDRSPYVMQMGNVRTTFEVGLPERLQGGVQRVPVIGKTELLQPDGSVFQTFSYNNTGNTGLNTLVSTVAFGYNGGGSTICGDGVYFLIVNEFGAVKGTGLNGCGQLGNGTTTNATSLQNFLLPNGKVAQRAYTNFLSVGYNSFVLTTNGEVWGSGYNKYGMLGNGKPVSSPSDSYVLEKNPVQYKLPADDNKAIHVVPNGTATFVVTNKGNVYGAGYNHNGSVGIGETANTHIVTPRKINLPAGEMAQANDDAWAADRLNVFLVTKSGKVYGWGDNHNGQLAQGHMTFSPSPVRIGTFGDSGYSKAVQVSFDGEAVYIVDDQGDVYSAGLNSYGSVGTRKFKIVNGHTGKCLTATGAGTSAGTGVTVKTQTCVNNDNQNWTYNKNNNLKVSKNTGATDKLCLRTYSDKVTLLMDACYASSILHKFRPLLINNIYYTTVRFADKSGWNKCVSETLNPADPGQLAFYDCNSSQHQQHWKLVSPYLQKVTFPGSKKYATRVTTDQYFATAVMTDGTAWSWGMNNGALGDGVYVNINNPEAYSEKIINWDPVQFKLPAGVKAIRSYTTSRGWITDSANTFIVADNCKVYGVGSNVYGQLGIGVIGGGTSGIYFYPQEMKVVGGGGTDCAKHVRAGYGTAIVFTSNGKVFTVGNNSNGQLGDGTIVNNGTPRENIQITISRKILFY